MFRSTLLLATAGLFCAFSMAPIASAALNDAATTTEIGWVISKVAGSPCSTVCTSTQGADVCNVAALNTVDTAAKLKYVVETELGRSAGTYVSGADAKHPSAQRTVYSYNPAAGSVSTCAGPGTDVLRICCCNSDAQFCPTSKPGSFGGN